MIGVSLSLSLIDITHTHTTDGGSHFSFGPFQGDSKIANALNDISCEFQLPVFPTASPYVVSVGGEMWKNGDSHKPITWTVRVSHQDTTWQSSKFLAQESRVDPILR